MRFLFVMVLTLSTVQGQSDVSKFLAQGLSGALATIEPVSEADKNAILAATAQVLSKHVTFRPDGTADEREVIRSCGFQPQFSLGEGAVVAASSRNDPW